MSEPTPKERIEAVIVWAMLDPTLCSQPEFQARCVDQLKRWVDGPARASDRFTPVLMARYASDAEQWMQNRLAYEGRKIT